MGERRRQERAEESYRFTFLRICVAVSAGPTLAEEKYGKIFFINCYAPFSHIFLIPATYKPILKEVEKILQEPGLDEEEMRGGAGPAPRAAGGVGVSHNSASWLVL